MVENDRRGGQTFFDPQITRKSDDGSAESWIVYDSDPQESQMAAEVISLPAVASPLKQQQDTSLGSDTIKRSTSASNSNQTTAIKKQVADWIWRNNCIYLA